ncbi:hypothetical protein Poli38472_006937 [Pythium oligandrum]|uniref:Plasma membrane proteolipid 3 n=1 Tax=Pythium oligandrum TaxID=41045 RepID=A0A8K1C912_PYTOL|nr:hypothetical protein Poli38472_006937 [Pythium oligandrum]|eukprot:TMW58792.1 hypothetical protein Poli38472_006937 [Pythium oligandrum]
MASYAMTSYSRATPPPAIAALIMPPLVVFHQFGWTQELVLNILLTLMGFVPGVVHAMYCTLKAVLLRSRYHRPRVLDCNALITQHKSIYYPATKHY